MCSMFRKMSFLAQRRMFQSSSNRCKLRLIVWLVPITQDTLEFDVHICVITANSSAHQIATLQQLQEEVEILNRRFVTLDGNPLVRFRFKSASFYEQVEYLNCPFVSLGDSTKPYSSSGYAKIFNECRHPKVRDPHAINFYLYDSYNSDLGFHNVTCHGKRNSNRPYILIDWERLNNTIQSPEVHEMGHAFGLGHVAVPGADRWTHTNIMCSIGLGFGSGGRRNLGFTEAQSAIVLYHAGRTYARLQ